MQIANVRSACAKPRVNASVTCATAAQIETKGRVGNKSIVLQYLLGYWDSYGFFS